MQFKIELGHVQRGQQSEVAKGKAGEDGCNTERGRCLFSYAFLANSAESSLLPRRASGVLEWRIQCGWTVPAYFF